MQDVEAVVGPDAWLARPARPYAHSSAPLEAGRRLWRSAYPEEPFELDMAAVAEDRSTTARAEASAAGDDVSRIGYDIIQAAHRQGIFYYDVRPAAPSARSGSADPRRDRHVGRWGSLCAASLVTKQRKSLFDDLNRGIHA